MSSSTESMAYMYPLKGIHFLFWRECHDLWQRATAFIIKVGFASTAILGTIVGFTFESQRDFLVSTLPEFWDHTVGAIALILVETTIPVVLLFYHHHHTIQEKLFDDVMRLEGVNVERASPEEREWIAKLQQQQQEPLTVEEIFRRHSNIIRVLPAVLIDPEILNYSFPKLKYFLTLPLNFIPIFGQALFCWLNAMETGSMLHHYYYFNLKGLSREEETTMIHYRKKQYIQFGLMASALTLFPGLNVILVLTNAIGAALWAIDIEKAFKEHAE